jgi:tetrachlorobenzoquinone reductase
MTSAAVVTPVTSGGRAELRLTVSAVESLAPDVMLLRLRSADGADLPAWRPGDHLELVLPSYRIRHYSLCGDRADRSTYTVAVLRVGAGRGGSVEIHDAVGVGTELAVRGPRNNFELVEAPAYLFLAGGIGITPLVAMADHVAGSAADWRLVYGARDRGAIVFSQRLRELGPDRVVFVPEDEHGRPAFAELIGSTAEGTALYCCGPAGMIKEVERVCAELGRRADLHVERFGGQGSIAEAEGVNTEFELELAATGVVLTIPADRTALEVVHEVLPDHPYSCLGGQCGSCEVAVLVGEVDHRDEVLSDAEHAANSAMTLCVSRARSARLVIEL